MAMPISVLKNSVFFAMLMMLACACGQLGLMHPASPASAPLVAELQPTYDAALADYNIATATADGHPSLTDCDDTVWAGTACLGGAGVRMTDLEYPAPGELQRRPAATGTCWQPGVTGTQPSASTASRDDAVLYMACLVKQGDKPALGRFQTYVQANGGFFGQPADPNLTLMTPTLNAILARAISGGSAGVDIEAPGVKDYQDHIEVEEVLLSTAVNGGANGWELALLESLAAEFPDDALFEAAKGVYTGDCQRAPALLLEKETPMPSYVRGDQAALFAKAWWLRAAALVLSHCKEST